DDCSVEAKPVMVRGDPMLLRRMIRNLVENAHLHGKPPIEVTVARQNNRAVVNVLDHGPVIVEDARERLFSAFYRIPGRGRAEAGRRAGASASRWSGRLHAGTRAMSPTIPSAEAHSP